MGVNSPLICRFQPFRQAHRWPRAIWVDVVELFEQTRRVLEVPRVVPRRIRVPAFPLDSVFELLLYLLDGEYLLHLIFFRVIV